MTLVYAEQNEAVEERHGTYTISKHAPPLHNSHVTIARYEAATTMSPCQSI